MKKIVVFTGAGVSADSGLATFRDSDVGCGPTTGSKMQPARPRRCATIGRRSSILQHAPPRCSERSRTRAIAPLRAWRRCFDGGITQNVDNLHERAGSSRVTHLHGELTKLRSSRDPELIAHRRTGTTARCNRSGRLPASPSYRLFGEAVSMFERAAEIAATADLMVVVGTSPAVYPAASLVRACGPMCRFFWSIRKSRYGDDPQSAHPYPFTSRRGHARTGGAVEVGILESQLFCLSFSRGRKAAVRNSSMICRVAPEDGTTFEGCKR